MSNEVTVEITQTGPNTGAISIDGHDISNAIYGISVEMGVHDIPRVHLQMSPGSLRPLTIRTSKVTTDLYDALIALGWTPPQEDM